MGVEVVLAAVAISAAVAGTAVSIKGQQEQKKAARKAEKLQKEQLAEQKRLATIQRRQEAAATKRQARIKAAQSAAGLSGAGVGGSLLEGSLLGIETSEGAAQEYIYQTGESQNRQFGIASSQISAEADAVSRAANTAITGSIINGVGSIASTSSGFLSSAPTKNTLSDGGLLASKGGSYNGYGR